MRRVTGHGCRQPVRSARGIAGSTTARILQDDTGGFNSLWYRTRLFGLGVAALALMLWSTVSVSPAQVDVPKTYTEAMQWYEAAAAAGQPAAQFYLGFMYQNGLRVPRDSAKALTWYRRAAERGHAQAQLNLAMMYQRGVEVGQDLAKARRWYEQAARQGLAEAAYGLGILHDMALGVPRDAAAAAEWYERAAGQGLALAQNNLAILLANGDGVPRDPARALRLYRDAAGQGLGDAEFNLGVSFVAGEGIEQDLVKAYLWLSRAAAHEGERSAALAEQALTRIEAQMSAAQISAARRLARSTSGEDATETE